jgi:conjugative relaxase-like TrwC/TraI family protein
MSAQAAINYHDTGLKRSDYYVREVGIWGGKGAEMLGLEGEVQRKDFVALAENRRPGTDERLTQRNNGERTENGKKKENRRAGYDFTFSVPKSISLYLAMNDDKELERSIKVALDDALSEVESRMETRVRKGYQCDNRVSPNMVYAMFVHRETRIMDGMEVPDPHYHVHVFVFNATFDEVEGEWKALETGNVHADRTFYEAVFNARLADRLIAAGIDIRRTEEHFELASVSRELVEKFSKRTREIEQYARDNNVKLAGRTAQIMREKGIAFDDAWAEAKAGLGSHTRKLKSANTLTPAEELEHWRSEMTAEEIQSLLPERIRGLGSRQLLEPEMEKELAVGHLFERRSVARPLHAAGMLLRRGIGKVNVEDALGFSKSGRFICAGNVVTTAEVLAEEKAMIETARAGQNAYRALGNGGEWEVSDERIKSDEGQSAALRHVLESRDLVTSVRGPAGTGKSTLMPETIRALESLSTKQVVVLAPSAEAVGVLKKEGLGRCETFQRFQVDPLLQNAAEGAIVWVDEAGFLSARQMRWLLDYAAGNSCRVVLCGDTRQNHGVERGDALRVLEARGAVRQVALSKIYRQQIPEIRAAVKDLSDGKTREGFEKLDGFGAIREIQDDDERLAEIATLHLEAVREKKVSLIVAPTHTECRVLAEAVRTRMKEEGLLGAQDQSFSRLQSVDLTESQRRDVTNYQLGQVVEFHQRARGGFRVGERYEVVEVADGAVRVIRSGSESKRVNEAVVNGALDCSELLLPLSEAKKFQVFESRVVDLAVGDVVRATRNVKGSLLNNHLYRITEISDGHIDLVDYRGDKSVRISSDRALHIDQGIVVTGHASQGKTVDQVILSVPISTFSVLDQAEFYVSMSRARYGAYAFTNSKEAFREAVCQTPDRLSPSEIIEVGLQAGSRKNREQEERALDCSLWV